MVVGFAEIHSHKMIPENIVPENCQVGVNLMRGVIMLNAVLYKTSV